MASTDEPDGPLWDDPEADISHSRSSEDISDRQEVYQPLWVRLAVILINFLIELYDQIRIVPEIALFEHSICRSYYSNHNPSVISPGGSIPEHLCKIKPVQRRLASFRGYKALFDGIASMSSAVCISSKSVLTLSVFIMAIPMGTLADKLGRKKVLATSILGPLLSTGWMLLIGAYCSSLHTLAELQEHLNSPRPLGAGGFAGGSIKLIWFSSAFYLLGNLSSANATVYAVAADSCPPSQRSRYFYYVYSTFLVCELFAPAIVSMSIDRSVLIPFGIGLGALALCYPILWAIPETHQPSHERSKKSRQDLTATTDSTSDNEPLLRSSTTPPKYAIAPDQENIFMVLRKRNLLLALVVLFVGAFRQATVSVLLQYATARFEWHLSRTAMLVSAIAVMNIVLFLFILPQCVAYLTSHLHIRAELIDYTIVFASLVILAFGSLFMGLAPTGNLLTAGKL